MTNRQERQETAARPARSHAAWWRYGIVVGLLAAAGLIRIGARLGAPTAGPRVHPIRLPADLPRRRRLEQTPGCLRNWNVLLVTLDTTRADHLGCYGNPDVTTPTIDRLAREGVIFAQAVAVVPVTLPAHSSLLTGLYPQHHGVRANGFFRLDGRFTTLAEVLSGAGYRTAAFVSAFVLDSRFGLDQGFDSYQDDMPSSRTSIAERPAADTNVPAMAWLRDHGRERYFLWVHYYDPHFPYAPPPPYDRRFASSAYDGEIAYMDRQLAALLGAIDQQDARSNTLVVVVGDHGEGLGQHHQLRHSTLLYESTARVPLILYAPGVLRPAVVTTVASLVDVMPTVIDLLGLTATEGMDGRSLLAPDLKDDRPVFLETLEGSTSFGWAPLFGIRTGDVKYVWAPREELFDLRDDPLELRNLFGSRPEQAAELRNRVQSFFGLDDSASITITANVGADDAALAKLEALGYVGGGPAPTTVSRHAPDPKDMVRVYDKVAAILAAYRRNDHRDRAIEQLEMLIAESPDNFFVHEKLGNLHMEAGAYAAALEQFELAYRSRPDSAGCCVAVANTLLMLHRDSEAVPYFRQAVELSPDHFYFDAHFYLGRTLYGLGRTAEAVEALRRATELAPQHEQAKLLYVRTLTELGRRSEVVTFLRESLELAGTPPDLFAQLATLLLDERKADEAVAVLRRGIGRYADDWTLAYNLSHLLARYTDPSQRDGDEAVRLARRACELTGYRDHRPLANLADVYAAFGARANAIAVLRRAVQAARNTDGVSDDTIRQLEQRLTELGGELSPTPSSEP